MAIVNTKDSIRVRIEEALAATRAAEGNPAPRPPMPEQQLELPFPPVVK